jgi:uncharacterized membrane protein YfcA
MDGLGFSVAGLVVGTAVGATGVGGGSLMTPILILFYGISPSMAVGTDLLYASISKAFGVALHGSRGTVDWKIVGWMALGSVPAALLTVLLLRHFEATKSLDHLIKLTLAIAIVVTATFTLFQEPLLKLVKRSAASSSSGGFLVRHQRVLTLSCGVLIGTLVTISSVGAGVIGMMLLLILYPTHSPIRLVGSDLAHAVIITAIAGIGHASLGTVNYSMLGWLLVGAIPGIWLGTRLAFRLNDKALKRTISAFLVFIGCTMAAKALATTM